MLHCADFISAGSLYMFRASGAHHCHRAKAQLQLNKYYYYYHQEYLKLARRPLVHVFCKIYNILTFTC